MLIRRKPALLACAALTAAAFAGAASAQQAPSPQPAQAPAAQQVQEVIVTASRRNERVQNVAGEVTALTGKDLSQMNAHSFDDFATSVPGLSFQSNSPTNNLIAIRGVASSTAELGSAVSMYLDDVPLGSSTQFGLGSQSFNFNLFDMDRVEVLNGPQGTLYGANALGGALKYVTQKPEMGVFDAAGEVEGSNTDHGGWNDAFRGMVNIPLFGDSAALRIDGLQSFDSGYTQDPTHERRDVGSAMTSGGRVSFEAHVTPDIDVRLTAFTQNIRGEGQNVEFENPLTHSPIAGSYDQSYAIAQPEDNSVTMFSGTVNWDLHWGKLTSVTAFQRNHGYYQTDDSVFYDTLLGYAYGYPGTATNAYDLYVDTNTKKFTQELRLASSDNKHFEWVIGGYFTREVTDEVVDLLDASSTNPTPANGALPPPYSTLPFYGYLPSTYSEIAGFGDATYYFTSWFDLTLGVRYSQQHQDYQSNISTLLFGPPFGQVYSFSSTSDQGVATYLFNPRLHLSRDVMLYARVSSGFRPGGPNFVLPPSFHSPVSSTFQPDKIWNYELGEKSTLLHNKLTLNADIYDIEWTGIQTTENVGGINQLLNAGNARVQGAETSFSYRVLQPLTISGSAAYTDAHLTTEAPALDVLYTGARLPLSPKYNFALSALYRFDAAGHPGTVSLSDVWVGDRTSGYAGSATNVLYKMPAYNTVNLNASLVLNKNLQLNGYIKNIFDTRGQLSANTLDNVFYPSAGVPVTLTQPMTIGFVLKVGLGGK